VVRESACKKYDWEEARELQPIIVRRATGSDLPAISGLMEQLGYPAAAIELNRRFLTVWHNRQEHRLLVAESDTTLAGLIHLTVRHTLMQDDFVEIVSLVVTESLRGRGVGRMLLSEAEQWALDLKLPSVRLYSNAVRIPTHQFYIQNGYVKVKDAVLLKKELS
jgi:N-acetylglutamate synthase-like GNAT family acetyltransferase